MGVKKLAAKVADYQARLESGKANKIKPGHVRKVLGKLRANAEELRSDIEKAGTDEKRSRLERKLRVAEEHIARAEYLLGEIA